MNNKQIKTTMPLQIEFDVAEMMEVINSVMISQIKTAIREEDFCTRGVINQYIKEMLYAQKDEIINMVVERASREMVRKGLPKLLAKMETE